MENINKSKKIAKNTIMLYFRQILTLFVNLYAVRVILNTLGVEDYGIYSVVGGIVTFFSFLSGTMASATQRFFSFALGKEDEQLLKKTFSTNLIIYLLIAIIAIVLVETLGICFFNNRLVIPEERFNAAAVVYHFSILTFIVSIVASPFMAIIIAHEDMQIYAYVSILEACLKLGVVFLLKLCNFDKLILYGILLFAVGIVNAMTYGIVCVVKYHECQFKKFYWDFPLFKETLSFTGWTLFGQLTTVFRTQAVTILINQVFSPIVVSARTIATQVSNYINVFSGNFNTGLYPSIIKSYASDEKEEMFQYVFFGCKITFFLMWIFSLPLFLQMDYVLAIWLETPPEGAVLFTRLALIEVLINAISMPITTAARAPGKMKVYELSLGSIQIFIFLADLVLFYKFHMEAFIVFIVAAIGNLFMFLVRLYIVKYLIKFPVLRFVKYVILPIMLIMNVSLIPSIFICKLLSNTFVKVFISVIIIEILCFSSMYTIGLTKANRQVIKHKIASKIRGRA